MTTLLEIGAPIAGRFVLVDRLGEGGMGEVWSARHAVTGKRVALKVLKGTGIDERRRFVQEARVAAAIRHPNVIEVHDVLELEDGRPLMVMDLLEGESLSSVLERRARLPVEELMPLALQVLAGLGAAHAVGVVHRDMKPDNIFLARGPGGEVTVKVLDFGIAKLTALASAVRSTHALTQTGSVLGTPHYMAPEQVFGEKSLDHRADFWSLGVVLYECLTGTCPIDGENIGQLFKAISQRTFLPLCDRLPELDREIASLIDAMMASRPVDRPESAREIAKVIARRFGLALPAIGEPRWSPNAPRRSLADVDALSDTAKLPAAKRFGPRKAVLFAAATVAVLGLVAARAVPDRRDTNERAAASNADSSGPSATSAPTASVNSASANATMAGEPNAASTAMPATALDGKPSPSMPRAMASAQGKPPQAAAGTTASAASPPTTPARTGGIYEISPY